jgi:hypothetical protein
VRLKEEDICAGSCKKTEGSHSISCDQVSWLLDIADRYIPKDMVRPSVSRQREMLKYGMLYEIMEIADLKFEDGSARWNGTPNEARNYDAEDQYQA